MNKADVKAKPNHTGSTRQILLKAAAGEFNSSGFSGTDTNRIARAAGFAPQTFYRHFADKVDIFIQVYERWQESELQKIQSVIAEAAVSREQTLNAATALIESHRVWAPFRRSLRLLAVEEPRVRLARAESRTAQLKAMGDLLRRKGIPNSVAALLSIERLCDAAADDEIGDLGISAAVWVEVVADAIDLMLS